MKEDINKELSDASFLSKMKGQKEGFELPDNYFHHLQVDMMQQLQEEEQEVAPAAEKLGVWQRWDIFSLPKLSFGLLGMALVAMITVGVLKDEGGVEQLAMEELSDEDLYEYLDTNIESFDLESLATLTDDFELGFITEGIETDQLDAYLDSRIDDLDDEDLDYLFN